VIVQPNNFWSRDESTPFARVGKPRLCWIVRYTPVGDVSNVILMYVDCGTGEIVGGMG
jgi:hypothetical protein